MTARTLLCTADFSQLYSQEPHYSGAENDGSFSPETYDATLQREVQAFIKVQISDSRVVLLSK